jgi:RNA polymerase sigma factor (sigma-70 family)
MPTPFEQVLRRARAGAPAGENALVADLYPDVQGRVHAALRAHYRPSNRWLAPLFSTNDIVQDVLLGVVRGLPSLEGHTAPDLRAWIAKQVEHRLLDRLRFHRTARRDARRPVHGVDLATLGPAVASSAGPAARADQAERARLLERALAGLDDGDRALWRARVVHEQEFDAVAAELGLGNAEAARGAFRRLRAKLAVLLRREGLSPVPG